MEIIRQSPFTGVVNHMEIDVTPMQIKAWENGMLIQRAMPNLTPDEREFIMSGITPEEWEREFGSEE